MNTISKNDILRHSDRTQLLGCEPTSEQVFYYWTDQQKSWNFVFLTLSCLAPCSVLP